MSAIGESVRVCLETPGGIVDLAAALVVGVCCVIVFGAVLASFIAFERPSRAARRQRSVVATGSMTAFFVVLYALIRFRAGAVPVPWWPARVALAVPGLGLVVAGCVLNIAGRMALGRRWANQVTLYPDQDLVTGGAYGIVRHPLYASIIWMFFGASLAYANGAAFLATALVFVPLMAYRAGQEERLLASAFPSYEAYRRRVGRFFWRPWTWKQTVGER